MDVASMFNQLVDSTPDSFLTKRDQFVNDVARENHIMAELLGDFTPKELLKTGPKLKDRVYLEMGQRLHTYTPGRKGEVQNPQTHQNISSHWACYKVDMTWTEAEEEFNVNAGAMTAEGMADHLKDVMEQKEQDVYTGAIEGFDDLSFATPNVETMENVGDSNDDAQMRSIPSWLNEEPNGLYTGYDETGNFTTIQGLDPARYKNWVPGQYAYDNADANFSDPDVDDNLLRTLVKSARRTDFKRPKGLPNNQVIDERTEKHRQVIITGELGFGRLEQAYSKTPENFMTISPTDPSFGDMTINGRRVIEYLSLDTARLYKHGSNTTDLVTAGDAAGERIGGRFYFINGKYLRMYFRKDKFFQKRTTRELEGTVGGYWCPIVMWGQMWVRSRRRHAIVYPK